MKENAGSRFQVGGAGSRIAGVMGNAESVGAGSAEDLCDLI